MNKVDFLKDIKRYTEEITKDILLPTRVQNINEEMNYKSPSVFCMRMPEHTQYAKKVPYIIHQILTTQDIQKQGDRVRSSLELRTVFCVYNEDEEEGALSLLNLMEKVRIEFLKNPYLYDKYILDLSASIETMIYTDDSAPYFAGEMATTWKLPSVEQEEKCLR